MLRTLPTPQMLAVAALSAIVVLAAWFGWQQVDGNRLQFVAAPPVSQGTPATELGRFNPQALYADRSNGVVTIDARLPLRNSGSSTREVGGSGFVVDANGYIITNSHVVAQGGDESEYVFVDFASGDSVRAAIVGIDYYSDLAVLKVDPNEVELEPVPLGDSDSVAVGAPVGAIGSPFGNAGSLSIGVVSAINRTIPSVVSQGNIPGVMQTDAAINKGNSGGPLFNSAGEVIGVNTQIRSESGLSEGVGFAIPINIARRSLEQIVENGSVSYAYLGLKTVDVTPQMSREFGLGTGNGAMVTFVNDHGAAAAAKLSTGSSVVNYQGERLPLGDQIIELGGSPVRNTDDMAGIVHRLEAHRPVLVKFVRDGKTYETRLTPTERQ